MLAVVIFALSILVGIFKALILTYLWSWFVRPVLAIPSPGWAGMFGLAMTIRLFVFVSNKNPEKPRSIKSEIHDAGVSSAFLCLLWGIGWITTLFM